MTTEPKPCTHPHHHWVIEQPNGPTSNGFCKHCGQKGVFSNTGGLEGKWMGREESVSSADLIDLKERTEIATNILAPWRGAQHSVPLTSSKHQGWLG